MRRVVSVWFPHWPTDRLHRHRGDLSPNAVKTKGLITALHDGRRRVVAAVDQNAAELGLRPGMAMAHALAMVPDLEVVDADPAADADALRRLALWCHRYTPIASPNAPDGLWLDIAGSAHLFRGEEALLQHLLSRLASSGLHARAALADTPGAAHALARHGPHPLHIAPPGCHADAIAALPVAALRLSPELEATLRRLGFEQIRHLARIPRPLLARRFGPFPGLRLDQVNGRVIEPLTPLPHEHTLQRRIDVLEPIFTAEAFRAAITALVTPLCQELERTAQGVRKLDLLFHRVDNQLSAIRIGTARPSRDARHLARLLEERLDTVDPGMGVETMLLMVPLAEPLYWEQQTGHAGAQDVARLVDRLSSRLGADRVYRASPIEHDMPEKTVAQTPPLNTLPAVQDKDTKQDLQCLDLEAEAAARQAPALQPITMDGPAIGSTPATMAAIDRMQRSNQSPQPEWRRAQDGRLHLTVIPRQENPEPRIVLPWKRHHAMHRSSLRHSWSAGRIEPGLAKHGWPGRLESPARIFAPPRLVKALAALPDQPPIAFTWRRRHKVRRSDGPERIHLEWWDENCPGDTKNHEMIRSVRDYFRVEDESGQRFWLFRQGDGIDSSTGDLQWYLHGLF